MRRLLVVTMAAATTFVAGCGEERSSTTAPPGMPAIAVRVAEATVTDVPELLEAGGTVRARTSAALSSRIVAQVLQVRVEPGATVRRGQTLIVLDDRDLAATVRQAGASAQAIEQAGRVASADVEAAQAALVLAQATHQRMQALFERQSATANERDQAVAGLRSAEARLAAARARVEESEAAFGAARAAVTTAEASAAHAVITAPFDGIVTEKLIEPGNMAAPGGVLMRVDQRGGFRLELRVDESRAAAIMTGSPIEVALEDPDQVVTGTVSEVSRAVDADTRTVLVKVDLPTSVTTRSGAFGRARWAGESRRALSVPSEALVRRGQVVSVFVVEEGRARVRLINAARSSTDRTEVLAGLEPGERVIVAPPSSLVDGAAVSGGGA